jgi:enoyl-[acyl-carrier-protein] reductase (NADH)
MVEAQEIGWLAAFLASDKGAAITGELISPNGGQGNTVFY